MDYWIIKYDYIDLVCVCISMNMNKTKYMQMNVR